MMAKLEHPHIVRIHDFFPYRDNACLVMSYVNGGSLQERLEEAQYEVKNQNSYLQRMQQVEKSLKDLDQMLN